MFQNDPTRCHEHGDVDRNPAHVDAHPRPSRDDVLAAAIYRYLRGRRVDVREIASELGLGRTTIFAGSGRAKG